MWQLNRASSGPDVVVFGLLSFSLRAYDSVYVGVALGVCVFVCVWFDMVSESIIERITCRVMANSVNAHIKQERVVKMKEQLKLERQETYHASILNDNLPPIAGKATPEDQKMSLLNQSLRHHRRQEKTKSEIGHVSATNLHRLHTELLVPLNQEQTKILSMSTALGSKAVKFGAGEMKKKKKKKKRQKTAKTKNK